MSLRSRALVTSMVWLLAASFQLSDAFADSNYQRIIRFAEELYKRGEFYRAITEYRRFLSYFPSSPEALDVHFKIFDCYFLGEHYLEAIDWSRRTQEMYPQQRVIDRTNFNIGKSLFALGNYSSARTHFYNVVTSGGDSSIVNQARYHVGMCYLMESDWEKASGEFGAIPPGSAIYEKAQFAARRSLDGKSLPHKELLLAGLLGIVPGGGYLYTGNVQTGIAAFVVNSLFFWGTYSAFDEGETGVGVVFGLFSLGWYAGSIYGSVVAAYKHSLRVKHEFWHEFDL